MSAKFFQSVRRNQKQWMVVVTVLSMVSFLFLENFGRDNGPMSAFGGAMMIGCLCGAGMCIIGYPRQKTMEFGLAGFFVGFIAGYLGFGAIGSRPFVRTASGSYSRADVDRLIAKRVKVNRFIQTVFSKLKTPGFPPVFGDASERSMIEFEMSLKDAQKMGVTVSDEAVNEFIKKLCQNKLTLQEYKDCLREAHVGEGELFDIVKDELSSQLALELTFPPAFVATAPPAFAQYVREPLRYLQQSPQQLWEAYQMLNLKESLDAVAIPVKDFVKDVGNPSEAELFAFFEKFKSNFGTDEAQPGFRQMPKVQLAYLTADYEKFEKGIEPTDEEIQKYYDKNKDHYRLSSTKDELKPDSSESPKAEDSEKPKEGDATTNDQNKDEKKPEAGTDANPPAVPEQKAKETKEGDAKPAEGAKPNPEQQKADQDKLNAATKPNDKPGKEKGNIIQVAAQETAAKQDSPAEQKPEAAKTEEPAKDKIEPKTDSPAKTEAGPALSDSPTSLPAPRFRELDDTLKQEIHDILWRERTFEKMTNALDRANFDHMIPLQLEYDTATDEKAKTEVAQLITQKMKDYANKQKLDYVEMEPMTPEELSNQPIGGAFEPQGRTPVVNEVFMLTDENKPRLPLYSPRRADLRSKTAGFAYWKISEVPDRVPELKEEAVREKVIAAWKFDQARSLAEKRAKTLADKAKADSNNLSSAIAEESATGDKNLPQLTIIDTPHFSWLSTPKSVPSAQQDPTITDIPLISNVANDFMKVVFEELNEGEIGVAADATRSNYYIVKVKERETAKDDGGLAKLDFQKNFFNERFNGFFPIMKSPYETLAQYPQRQIDSAWRDGFTKRHQIEWDDSTPAAQARPVSRGSRRRR